MPRIVLISPNGPLYRHKGGIIGQTLRYMPLTLPTLAALVSAELQAELICLDEVRLFAHHTRQRTKTTAAK
jgi:hypothetical protein